MRRTRSLRPVLGCVLRATSAAVAGALLALAWAAPAQAHGGRFQGPGGRVAPGDPTVPTPSAPSKGPPPVTPGSGLPTTTGRLPDVYWGTWWELNSWAYLPDRGAALRARRVTTGGPAEGPTREELGRERRALLARQHIRPFLLHLLERGAAPREDGTVTSAALLALGRIDASDGTLELLLRFAEDPQGPPLERESAALAVGLVRRSDPTQAADPISLDLARGRLLALVAGAKVPPRARCFAAFALGLLADQPYGSPFHRDGRLVVKGLAEQLAARQDGPDLPIALLTALALQPPASIPTQLEEDLRRAVAGGRVYRREWSPLERAHALSTYARLRREGWLVLTLRVLSDRRMPDALQRAARLVLGEGAEGLGADERREVAEALLRSARLVHEPLAEGLGQIALGRVLAADLRAGGRGLLESPPAGRELLARAQKSFVSVRGFHALALALSARGVHADDEAASRYLAAARATLLEGFDRPHGDADLRSAYAVALGLLEVPEARARLVAALRERNSGPVLRARAAVALAQIGAVDADTRAALTEMMEDTRPLAPRSAAALALTLLTGQSQSATLVRQLREADSQREQVAAAAALGQLDDPAALPALIAMARETKDKPELRALAIAVMGLIGDPEERPSLLRLSIDANYIGRTDALTEAFTLL